MVRTARNPTHAWSAKILPASEDAEAFPGSRKATVKIVDDWRASALPRRKSHTLPSEILVPNPWMSVPVWQPALV